MEKDPTHDQPSMNHHRKNSNIAPREVTCQKTKVPIEVKESKIPNLKVIDQENEELQRSPLYYEPKVHKGEAPLAREEASKRCDASTQTEQKDKKAGCTVM